MDELEVFYNKALRFLSYRSRSEKEVRDNLKKSSFAKASERQGKNIDEIISLVIVKLKDYKFLDDLEFAKMWAKERSLLKLKPIRVIKYELKQKGISDEIIEKVIDDSKDEPQDDLKKAKEIIQKKIEKYKNLPKFEIREKLGRFLASRGFDYDTIKKAIDEVLADRV